MRGFGWAGWALLVLVAIPAAAQEPLRVAVREVPPFAMKHSGGNWEGLSVDLWQDVADKLNLTFDWVELDLEQTLTGLEAGQVDVAVAALTITGEREQRVDFSHAYHVGGLALAYDGSRGNAWLTTLRGFVSAEFFSAVGTLILVLLIAGFAVWWFERRENAEQFGEGNPVRGLGDGFWWSAVTMTTVGYGDKAPRTLGGRAVALIWMFTSLIIIAGFTASIAASLTANRLELDLLRSRSLSELTVGVLRNASSDEYATQHGGRVVRFASIPDALQALERGQVEVVMHDAAVLRHHVRAGFPGIEVAEKILVREDYGFGLPGGSPRREAINIALLSILHEPVWQNIQRRYLGPGSGG